MQQALRKSQELSDQKKLIEEHEKEIERLYKAQTDAFYEANYHYANYRKEIEHQKERIEKLEEALREARFQIYEHHAVMTCPDHTLKQIDKVVNQQDNL
jgi:predicted RNase H-like nuclease (RuvC/YqgF family)